MIVSPTKSVLFSKTAYGGLAGVIVGLFTGDIGAVVMGIAMILMRFLSKGPVSLGLMFCALLSLCSVAIAGPTTDHREAVRLASVGLHDRIDQKLSLRLEAAQGARYGESGWTGHAAMNASLPQRYPHRAYQGPLGTNYVLGQPARNLARLAGNWPGPIATAWREEGSFPILRRWCRFWFGRCR